jgi:tRNA pseudouridine55 synthase
VSSPFAYPVLDRHTAKDLSMTITGEACREFFEQGRAILIDKPATWTSFDAVHKIRRLTRTRRVGHSGTLDPFATGLLIVCTGKATKSISALQGLTKSYEAVFEFGTETDTLDCDGQVTETTDRIPSPDDIESALDAFRGLIDQVPPAFSALKVGGQPSYRLARKQKAVPLQPRRVEVLRLDLIDMKDRSVRVVVTCSKGTYIRSLARDLGRASGSLAFVKSLRRTAIGPYDIADALRMDEFQSLIPTKDFRANHS